MSAKERRTSPDEPRQTRPRQVEITFEPPPAGPRKSTELAEEPGAKTRPDAVPPPDPATPAAQTPAVEPACPEPGPQRSTAAAAPRMIAPQPSAAGYAPRAPAPATVDTELIAGTAAAEPTPAGRRAFSVSEIVRLAARQLESGFGDVWVEGEVSNLGRPPSGHLYFTLKDARAQLAVVMFRSQAGRLKFRLEDGLMLCCRGRLTVYDAQGRFQLTAEAAEPVGFGALQLALEQLRRKLAAEGLFAEERKKPLPRLPRTIAVVTSPSGAAVHDIIRVLHRRCPVRVVVCPTSVQGAEAAGEIVQALRRADTLGADLIIVGRGGGTLEDLWAFNTEAVVRAIAAAATPVISAVGHEVDVTLADLVADRRAPTPSAAAEMAVPVQLELVELLGIWRARLHRAQQQRLRHCRLALEAAQRHLGSPAGLLERSRMRLDDAAAKMATLVARQIARERELLGRHRARLGAQEPRVRLGRDRARLVALRTRLDTSLRRRLQVGRDALGNAASRLDALSPMAVLARGYSLAQDSRGELVRDASSLAEGDRLLLRFSRGEARCTVDSISPRRSSPEGSGQES